jgi:hypothetical protein
MPFITGPIKQITSDRCAAAGSSQSQQKEYFKMSTTEIANKMIETIVGAVGELSASQKQALLDKLAVASVSDLKANAEAKRMSKVAAATQNQPALIKRVVSNLKRISLSLEDVIEGGVTIVDKATKEAGLDIESKFRLKADLRAAGVIG